MKIINIGILAHVDAGKTTLTESLLYTSGAIMEPGSVDKGTTRTDSMALERQRKITIQAAVTSFRWKGYKVNLVDTPGHMDFLTEVHRSLSVLDGAILVVSAKDGVQAQTRVLFHALRKMKIPTIIFINKIDQSGVVLEQTYQNIREKLTEDMMVMQEVHLFSELTLSDVADFEKWDAVIAGNDNLLEKYLSGAPLTLRELQEEIKRRVQQGTFFPVYHGSAKENIGTKKLLDVITDIFSSKTDNCQSELCGYVFKIEYTEQKKRRCYLRLYNVIKSIHILRDRNGLNFPTDGINISTVGPLEQLKKIREEHLKIQLTLSLHATNQRTRDIIIPHMKGYDINKIVESVLSYSERHNRKVTIAYLLIPGLNDKATDVRQLTKTEIEAEITKLESIPEDKRTAADEKQLGILKDTRYFEEEYYVHIRKGIGKGGRERYSPIIGEHQKQIADRIIKTPEEKKVWEHIHGAADIHGYRAEYATAVYKAHARDIKDIPYDKINKGTGRKYQSDVYTCRKDEVKRKLDRAAMTMCSKALGHNRAEVFATNYLRGL